LILHPYIKYRSDIDGLRALAVLSVILFHIDKSWIPGGFLGVDIFFVISGYLITLILTREIDKTNKVNITNFYKRRIKRIIPALLFVLIPTFIVGFILMAPDDLMNLSKSMVWSFFSAANIYFFSSIDTGYFATGSSELPLLHLWSLGVEEQFYILWPFAVLLLLKYIKSLKKRILIATALFVVSLVWAQTVIVSNHSFAYYMLFTRAWELLAGAIVALLVHSGFRTKNIVNELMAFTGLLTIILSFIFVSESDSVPGIAALPLILGASLLILSGVSYKTYIGRILSLKLFVAIGLVSYSAYLWHWPILAFLRYTLVDINLKVALIVIFVTFAMAIISYFLIESPLRKNDISTRSVYIWYFFIPALIIISFPVLTKQRLKQQTEQILPASAYKYNCQFIQFDTKAYEDQRCVYPEHIQKADVFLIGDSNAAHYLGMLRNFANDYGFSIRNATQSSCPLLLGGEFDWIDKRYKKGCTLYRNTILAEAKKYDTVIIGGSWNYYYHKKGFQENFINTINILSKNIKHLILLAKVPLFPGYDKNCEIKAKQLNHFNCSNKFDNNISDDVSNHFLQSIAKKYQNVDYFDIRKQVCHEENCSPYLDGFPVYYDGGHLSMHGSERIGEKMIETNDPMLQLFEILKNKRSSQ